MLGFLVSNCRQQFPSSISNSHRNRQQTRTGRDFNPRSLTPRILFVSVLATACGMASDLFELAGLDAASGDESKVIEFVANRIGGTHQTGNNGTLVARFGEGETPRILLVAGVDEPGYAVSGIQTDGYLRLQPLADAPFGVGLGRYFLGQHVRISTMRGRILPGVVAAPSVHFGSRGNFRRTETEDLFVDIGASSAGQVQTAGVSILDRVTLEKRVTPLGNQWLAAPWISSRVGAALLLDLARHLTAGEFSGQVALAFVTQQYPYNAGIVRLLGSLESEQVVLLLPNGDENASIAPIRGQSDSLVREIADLASSRGIEIERKPPHGFDFGPFGRGTTWRDEESYAVLWPGVENSATPSAMVRKRNLSEIVRLLSELIGVRFEPLTEQVAPNSPQTAEPPAEGRPLWQTMERLVDVPGVSGNEEGVRTALKDLVPPYARDAMSTDDAGNLIVRLGTGEQPDATFIAHMDEIGFSITRISSNGSVTLQPKGGTDLRLFSWQPMVAHGSRGSVNAVMTSERSMVIGEPDRAAVAERGVREGDTATVFKRFRRLLNDRVSARSLDDRLGCATLLEALKRLEGPARRARGTVDFVFSVEEEVGLLGARHYAKTASADRVFAIDTFVTSDSPLESKRIAHARLGAGAVLRALDESGMTPTAEIARITTLARQLKIPLQLGVTAGGNDGSVFQSLKTVNVPIGFPLRYAHSAVETADLKDAEAVLDLVEALALEALRKR